MIESSQKDRNLTEIKKLNKQPKKKKKKAKEESASLKSKSKDISQTIG